MMETNGDSNPQVGVLFVCLGNICRSTMAEGVFRHLWEKSHPKVDIGIDSCGIGSYHEGDPPDSRTMSTLEDHGITDYVHSARQIDDPSDFYTFKYLLAMDTSNLRALNVMRENEARRLRRGGREDEIESLGKVMLFGDFGGKKGEVIQDPYYGGRDGFSKAYKQALRFSEGLIKELESEIQQGA